MSVIVLPVFAVAVYLAIWNAGARGRNARAWEHLLNRLRREWNAQGQEERSLWREGLNATPEDVWLRIGGGKGLSAMYRNAGVMLEMADLARRDSMRADRKLLAELAKDAMHIRVYVLIAQGQMALARANDNARTYAFHAAKTYAEMAARMVQLLQTEAAGIVPEFVAAL